MKLHVTTRLNGEPAEFLCEPHETLLDALRNGVGLTGAKEGCGTGDCGACSVLLDGRLVCACLVLAAEAEGRAVSTVEGIAGPDKLHPVQQQLLEHAGLQCGVCTPGIVVAAKALLDRNPSPTRAEVVEAISGNICRCTGYEPIINAVLAAATSGRARA